ncbi:MAG: nuclear transport factor 2 family protein [Bacteroidia bacterium]|nr:nuclear transport factor 2 family protein [Bacteroidia bacterium]
MNRLVSIFIVFMMALTLSSTAQSPEQKQIKKTILAFSKAGDKQDAAALEKLLDGNYRIVMNQLFGSKEVAVMPRTVYLDKIRKGEFGGDKRTVDVEEVLVNGNTATAKVAYKGEKMSFSSFIVLVKDVNESWKLISEVPVM